MLVPVYNINGKTVDELELRDDVFGVPLNKDVVHQAVVRQLANRRKGTANTLTRSEVAGSGRKLFSQKHTGRARRGDIRSPLLRGGGVVFGPHPRTYGQSMPKKMRQLALKCVLSNKLAEGNLKVVDKLELESPKTKNMLNFLAALGISNSALIALPEFEVDVFKSARNLPEIKVLPVSSLNVVDLLSFRMLLVTPEAVRCIEKLWGG